MKKRSPYEPILFAGLILTGILLGLFSKKWLPNKAVGNKTKIEQIMSLLESQYVDSLNDDEIEEKAIREFLSSYDPHSVYIPSRYVSIANQELKGGFDGIGIEFFMLKDTAYVVRVIPDGPAAKAGIKPGDRLLMADTSSLIGLKNTEIIELLKGEKDTEVRLKFRRHWDTSFTEVKVSRAAIGQESVRSTLLDESTIYFKIYHFAEPTHREFKEQFKKLSQDREIKKMIMDFRNNPGGYLKTAIDLLDEFVDGRQLLAYTKGKNKHKKSFYASPGGLCSTQELICLVNEGSASASEIFSGAIQDLDRGVIMGQRSYGKGLVQESFQLNDGSQVRLTVSRYYIPSGRSIQKPYDDEGYKAEDDVHYSKGEIFETSGGRKVKAEGGVSPDLKIDLEEKRPRSSTSPEISAEVLDRLYKLKVVDATSKPAVWLKNEEVQKAIAEISGNDSIGSGIRKRLVYQLWGPQSELEEFVSEDKWIQMARQQFGKTNLILNP